MHPLIAFTESPMSDPHQVPNHYAGRSALPYNMLLHQTAYSISALCQVRCMLVPKSSCTCALQEPLTYTYVEVPVMQWTRTLPLSCCTESAKLGKSSSWSSTDRQHSMSLAMYQDRKSILESLVALMTPCGIGTSSCIGFDK